jgi:hypothetical protein
MVIQQNAQKDLLDFGLLPPPPDLIKKSVVEDEEFKTGAPIPFLRFDRLLGKERQELMNENESVKPDPREPTDIKDTNILSDYMLYARDANRLVYCRFGDRYINDIEKKKNSLS